MAADKARIGRNGLTTKSGSEKEAEGRVYGLYQDLKVKGGVLTGDVQISIDAGSFTRGKQRTKEKLKKDPDAHALFSGYAHIHYPGDEVNEGDEDASFGDFPPYIEFNVARVAEPRKIRFFDSFDELEKAVRNSDPEFEDLIRKGMTPDEILSSEDPALSKWKEPYIKSLVFTHVSVMRAFIDAGWPADRMRVKEFYMQMHATIEEETARALERYIYDVQTTRIDYGPSDFATDAVSYYLNMPDFATRKKNEKPIYIDLGDYAVIQKRSSQNNRRNMLDGYISVENGKFYITVKLGVRKKTDKEKELEETKFYSTEEIDAAIAPYCGKVKKGKPDAQIKPVQKKGVQIVSSITLKNDWLCKRMKEQGWTRLASAGKEITDFWGRIYSYHHDMKGRPRIRAYAGAQFSADLTGSLSLTRLKANYECEFDFAEWLIRAGVPLSPKDESSALEYIQRDTPPDDKLCVAFNINPVGVNAEYIRVYSTEELEAAIIKRNGGLEGENKIVRIRVSDRFAYEAFLNAGWTRLEYVDRKRALHPTMRSELAKAVAVSAARRGVLRTNVMQEAYDAYLKHLSDSGEFAG